MRLLVLTEDFYPSVSGGAHNKWRFCQIAAARGHDVIVYTYREGSMRKREDVDGVEIHRPFKAKPDSLPAHATLAFPFRLVMSAVLCLYLLFHLQKSDIDGVYSGSNTLHWVGTVIGRWQGVPGVSFIGYTPSLDVDDSGMIKRLLETLTFRYALCPIVFCRNAEICDRVRELSDRRASVIHGVLNTRKIRAAYDDSIDRSVRDKYADPDEILLVFVGRLSEIKNVPAAVETVGKLPESYRLVIVGDGPERDEIERMASREEVDSRVNFFGELEHKEALSIIAVADGLLLPSRVESYPTVAFEGLALGCEVFATPVGILREISHPRLHLGPVDQFTETVRTTDFSHPTYLDEEALQTYSIERYTDTILQVFDNT